MNRGAPSRLSLKGRALQLLAQREHSRTELRCKLLPYAALTDGATAHETPAHGRQARGGASPATPRGLAGAAVGAGVDTETDADGRAALGAPAPPATPLYVRGSARRPEITPESAARVDALLDWLEEQGWLSDARFVESRVRARSERMGTLRIRQELARHGTELPAETAQELRASEASRAEALWQRKFGEPADDAAGRARQMRFLAARGFDPEVVRRVVPPPRRRQASDAAED